MKFVRKLDQCLEEWILGVALIAMSIILFVQIFMRAIVGSSLTWAEEVARYFYVWSVFLSISCTIRKRNILKVDLVLDMFPSKIRRVIDIVIDVVNVGLYAFLAYYSVSTVQGVQNSGQTSPALEIPMYLVYMIIPIGFSMASLRSIQKIYFDITGRDDTQSIDPSESV